VNEFWKSWLNLLAVWELLICGDGVTSTGVPVAKSLFIIVSSVKSTCWSSLIRLFWCFFQQTQLQICGSSRGLQASMKENQNPPVDDKVDKVEWLIRTHLLMIRLNGSDYSSQPVITKWRQVQFYKGLVTSMKVSTHYGQWGTENLQDLIIYPIKITLGLLPTEKPLLNLEMESFFQKLLKQTLLCHSLTWKGACF